MDGMRAVRKIQPGIGLSLSSAPVPKPGSGEVLVKVKACSLCGTDIHIYKGDPPWDTRIRTPRTIGHELCGEVIGLGPGVARLQEGDLVSAESHIFCGSCDQCTSNNRHICRKIQFFGVDVEGFFAEYAVLPEVNAWKNPAGMKPEIASLQESMGNSVYTVSESKVSGKVVAIFGLGPTGQFAVGVAKHLGAKQIIVIGGTEQHFMIAKRMGAHVIINRHAQDPLKSLMELTGGLGVDVALEMSGSGEALQQALKAVRPTGAVSMLGLPIRPVTIDLSKDVVLKDLTFRGIYGRRVWETWEQTSRLLKEGLDITPVITHRLTLEDYQQGIDAMLSSESGKVVFFPER